MVSESCRVYRLRESLSRTFLVYQGGDWGHPVRILSPSVQQTIIDQLILQVGLHTVTHFGHKHVKAWHSNMPEYVSTRRALSRPLWSDSPMYSSRDPTLFSNPLLYLKRYTTLRFDKDAQKGLRNTAEFYQKGRGYAIEHCTKPQTLGYGLADSPVGLLAWIYEKLVGWTDKYPWTDDEGTSPASECPTCAHRFDEVRVQCSSGSQSTGSRSRALPRLSGSTTR